MLNTKLKALVVYHDNCMDGLLSAMIIYHALHQTFTIDFVPAQYGDAPPCALGYHSIFVVDFSYEPEVLASWDIGQAMFYLFDHHQLAIQKLVDAPALGLKQVSRTLSMSLFNSDTWRPEVRDAARSNFYLAFNEGKEYHNQRSGSGLVLCYFRLSETDDFDDLVPIVKIAEAYDLWHHEGEEMHDNTYLSFFFKEWLDNSHRTVKDLKSNVSTSGIHFKLLFDSFMKSSLEDKLRIGKAKVIYHTSVCHVLCKYAYRIKSPYLNLSDPNNDLLNICFIPIKDERVSVSMLGSLALRQYGWDVAVMLTKKDETKAVLTMRSNSNGKNVDVAAICSSIDSSEIGLSGGGHRNAAGCTIKIEALDDLLIGNLAKRPLNNTTSSNHQGCSKLDESL